MRGEGKFDSRFFDYRIYGPIDSKNYSDENHDNARKIASKYVEIISADKLDDDQRSKLRKKMKEDQVFIPAEAWDPIYNDRNDRKLRLELYPYSMRYKSSGSGGNMSHAEKVRLITFLRKGTDLRDRLEQEQMTNEEKKELILSFYEDYDDMGVEAFIMFAKTLWHKSAENKDLCSPENQDLFMSLLANRKMKES